MNRLQVAMLAFLLLAWLLLVAILLVAPDVYAEVMKLPAGDRQLAELGLLALLAAIIALSAVGVVRRWRWLFWLLLVAFLAGGLRVPASLLQLAGLLPVTGPTWYALLQAGIGAVQFGLGLAMLRTYRQGGVWGRSGRPARDAAEVVR